MEGNGYTVDRGVIFSFLVRYDRDFPAHVICSGLIDHRARYPASANLYAIRAVRRAILHCVHKRHCVTMFNRIKMDVSNIALLFG